MLIAVPTIGFAMRRITRITPILLTMLLVCTGVLSSASVLADTATAVPSLTISQFKITSSNGQFVMLYNSTNSALSMANYQLEYFNSFDLGKASSSKLITLSGVLPPHGYYLLNDANLQMCFQMYVASQTLGFSSTAGMLELVSLAQANPGGVVQTVIQDAVSWSKIPAQGAITLPANQAAFLLRQPTDSNNSPKISEPAGGSWLVVQQDTINPCVLVNAITSQSVPSAAKLLPVVAPTASFVTAQQPGSLDTSLTASLPESDAGLSAPAVSEVLPNPLGTGNDATDEYIELYNANDAVFDLSGFSIRSGTTTTHTYVFAAGTLMQPHSYTAFYSSQTKLSLSNTSGQAALLDPVGAVLSSSGSYTSAADGNAWVQADNKWQYTTHPTPGAANIIALPLVKVSTKAATTKKTKIAAVAKTKATKTKKPAAAPSKLIAAQAPAKLPVHVWQLALVAGLAVLYALYEFRHDIANRLWQRRSYKTGSPEDRGDVKGGRSD